MSVFKSSGIILKTHKMRDGKLLYTVFSDMYGKIMCSKKYSKTEKSVDVGYVINFEIITKQDSDIHSIKNIKIISELQTENKNFTTIVNYLELIASILNNNALGIENLEIYNIVPSLHKIQDHKEFYNKIILAKLKLKQLLWDLPWESQDPTVVKILWFIHTHKIQDVLKLSQIKQEIIEKLVKTLK